ncbi:MAG: ABC transporter ATP-binding protein [Candidatus Hodarchaeota archaeon]
MSEPIIEVKNLTKYYKIKENRNFIRDFFFPVFKDFLAIKNLSFNIENNEIFGILGPNGAGKTTLIKLICGLLAPSSGSVKIDKKLVAKNLFEIQKMIGIMFGNTMIYNRMTGFANLRYYCRIYNIRNYKKRIRELLELVDLYAWRNQLVESYSLGMKSKLAISRALIHDPKILILDEPTLGLDVKNSIFIRNLLKKMEKTIIVTTHNMEVANDVCSRIALLNKGSIIKIDKPENLRTNIFDQIIVEIETPKIDSLKNLLKKEAFVEQLKIIDDFKLHVQLKHKKDFQNLLKITSEFEIWDLKKIIPTLEEVFLKVTLQ